MARRPRGAIPTKDLLLSSALELFSSRWYETVSVAEICRNAKLSNGIFYRYFRGKEAILRELLERFLEHLQERLRSFGGRTISERLDSFLLILIQAGTEKKEMLSVFREGQYRFPEYEGSLRDLYMEALSRVYERNVNESEYIFITGGVRFLIFRCLYNKLQIDKDLLKRMILEGIFQRPILNPSRIFTMEIQPLPREVDESSRGRLIDSGIRLFGERGYFNVNVYEIAKDAGYSVGTFYLYFASKEELISEIVRLICHRTRFFISRNLNRRLNRLEQELQGMSLFLKYFSGHRNYYEIVREAEFVVNQEVGRYYDRFEEGYLKNMIEIKYPDQRTIVNALIGISHYLGIEILFYENIADQENAILDLGRYLHEGISE